MTNTQTRNIIRNYRKLQAQIAELEAEAKELKSALIAEAEANGLKSGEHMGTTLEYVTYVVTADSKTWDTKALEKDGLADKYKTAVRKGSKTIR